MPKLIQIHVFDPGPRHKKWSGNRLAYSVRPFTENSGAQGATVTKFRVTLKVGNEKKEMIFNSLKILGVIDYDL